MADFDDKTLDDWRALAEKELKGRAPEDLVWQTPEGIAVKPLYTAEDLEAAPEGANLGLGCGAPLQIAAVQPGETVLDLGSLRPKFAAALGDADVTATWFAMLLHSSTVCALTGVETRFADLAGSMLDALAARRGQTLTDHERADILGGFAALPPHADIVPALRRLRSAGYRTVAFTNSSLDLVTRQIGGRALVPCVGEALASAGTLRSAVLPLRRSCGGLDHGACSPVVEMRET